MHCRTCDDLVAAYTSAVDLYTAVAQDIGTLAGDDFRLASKQAGLLRQAAAMRAVRYQRIFGRTIATPPHFHKVGSESPPNSVWIY